MRAFSLDPHSLKRNMKSYCPFPRFFHYIIYPEVQNVKFFKNNYCFFSASVIEYIGKLNIAYVMLAGKYRKVAEGVTLSGVF